jgi:hypothetical protein
MSTLHTGRCLCGAVTYECGPPVINPSFCHCESCRRAAGAHVVAWATVKRDSFRITTGSPRSYASSPPVTRQFCEHCGTPLTYSNAQWPDTIDVTIATLDHPNSIQPAEHIWMEDALSWDRPNDGLSQHPRGR